MSDIVFTEHNPPIREVSLILTYRCNCRCVMCLQRPPFRNEFIKRFPETMEFADWCRVIDQLEPYRNSIKYIYITGGEPFLMPFIFDLIAYIKRRRFICAVNTNGLLFPDRVDEILATGVDILILSLDGPASIHNAIRGDVDNGHSRIMAGIRKIIIQRKWLKPRLFVNCTVQEANYEHLDEWAAEVAALNVDHMYLHLQMFISKEMSSQYALQHEALFSGCAFSQYGAIATPQVNTDILIDVINRLRHDYPNLSILHPMEKIDLGMYFSEPANKFRTPPMTSCLAANNILEVGPDGSVITCHDFPDFCVGNLHEAAVNELWTSPAMNSFRSWAVNGGMFSICHRCCMSERYATYYGNKANILGAFTSKQ